MTDRQKTILAMFNEKGFDRCDSTILQYSDKQEEIIFAWWIDEPDISAEKLLKQIPIEDIERMYDDTFRTSLKEV